MDTLQKWGNYSRCPGTPRERFLKEDLKDRKTLFVASPTQTMANRAVEFQQNALLLEISDGYNFLPTKTFTRHIYFNSTYTNKEIST
jgi:hypothetical protein